MARSTFPRTSAWNRPGFLLWHAGLRWQRDMAEALRPLGLTHVQFVLLASTVWLENHLEGLPSQRELAEHAGTDAMMTSQVVRALEAQGLLERGSDPHDARVRRIRSTSAGRGLAERAVGSVEQVDREFFGHGVARDETVGVLRQLSGRDQNGEPTVR